MKNQLGKRAAASVLALLTVLLNAAACGDTSGGDTQTTTSSGGTETSAPITEDTAEKVEIPDVKYDGYEFRVMGVTESTMLQANEIAVESETGETLNDAVFARNRMVEEKLGVKITYIPETGDNIILSIGKSVLAGDDDYDAAIDHTDHISSGIINNYLVPISEIPYIDVEKSWWNTDLIESAAINGKPYFLMGDISYSWKNATWALCFNKRLYADYDLEEPYAMVRDGKWTLEMLESHCRDITKDLNGDSKLDKEDQWGLLSSKTAGIGLVTSTGITTITTAKDGSLEYALESERNVNVLEAIRKFISNNDLQLRAEDITGSSNIWTDIINIFRDGRALYRITVLGDVVGLRDMNDDFGIFPLPKYDEEQDSYYTTVQAWNIGAYIITASATNLDRTGTILEYMGSVSKDTITKAYYDVTLNGKVARDDESSEMLDIIFNSAMTTDVGLAFNIGDVTNTLKTMINSDTDNIASTLASSKDSTIAAIQKFEESVK